MHARACAHACMHIFFIFYPIDIYLKKFRKSFSKWIKYFKIFKSTWKKTFFRCINAHKKNSKFLKSPHPNIHQAVDFLHKERQFSSNTCSTCSYQFRSWSDSQATVDTMLDCCHTPAKLRPKPSWVGCIIGCDKTQTPNVPTYLKH